MYLGMKLDLVASRKIIERKSFQVAEEINCLQDHLAAKMIITHETRPRPFSSLHALGNCLI